MGASPKSSSYMQLPWTCTNGDQTVRSGIPNRRGCFVYMSSCRRNVSAEEVRWLLIDWADSPDHYSEAASVSKCPRCPAIWKEILSRSMY